MYDHKTYMRDYNKKRREDALKAGLCVTCNKPSPKRKCQKCLDRQRVSLKQRKKDRREGGLCVDCGKVNLGGQRRCVPCRDKSAPGIQRSIERLREDILSHYGPVCACCGETEPAFLTIDHMKDDGKARRADRGNIGEYRRIRREWPDDIQILCMNCNWGRRLTGICPHKRGTSD